MDFYANFPFRWGPEGGGGEVVSGRPSITYVLSAKWWWIFVCKSLLYMAQWNILVSRIAPFNRTEATPNPPSPSSNPLKTYRKHTFTILHVQRSNGSRHVRVGRFNYDACLRSDWNELRGIWPLQRMMDIDLEIQIYIKRCSTRLSLVFYPYTIYVWHTMGKHTLHTHHILELN